MAGAALGEPGVQISWQAQYTEPSGGLGGHVVAAGLRLLVVEMSWQAQHFVNLECRFPGRHSAQSLQEERVDAWSPLARLPVV